MATTKRTKAPATPKADVARTTPAPTAIVPSIESIATRAYQIWRESGGAHGNDQAHWFRAEQELRARTTAR